MTNKQAYAGLLERLLESCIDWTGEPIVDGSTPRYELSCGDIREAAEAISSLLKALEAIAGMLSGYAGQPNHMGDVFKIADAALNSDAPLSIGEEQ